jgi:hypothetical protein
MAKRGGNKVNPSFFPFVSVLIALIGVLIFIVLTLTVTAVKPKLIIEAPLEWSKEEQKFFKRKNVVVEFSEIKPTLRAKEYDILVYENIEFDADAEWKNVEDFYKKYQQNDPKSWTGTPFLDFVADVASRHKTHFISFLLRPAGVRTYSLLSEIINRRNSVIFDKDEYPGVQKHWVVDWTLVYLNADRKFDTDNKKKK